MSKKRLDYPEKQFRREGRRQQLVEIEQKKLAKDYSIAQIADALEESIETIQKIVDKLE